MAHTPVCNRWVLFLKLQQLLATHAQVFQVGSAATIADGDIHAGCIQLLKPLLQLS